MKGPRNLAQVYLVMAIVGALVPWLFLVQFFISNDFSFGGLIRLGFANVVATAFTTDLLITAVAVLMLIALEGAGRVALWARVACGMATVVVGPACGLPLYLWFRETAKTPRAEKKKAPRD